MSKSEEATHAERKDVEEEEEDRRRRDDVDDDRRRESGALERASTTDGDGDVEESPRDDGTFVEEKEAIEEEISVEAPVTTTTTTSDANVAVDSVKPVDRCETGELTKGQRPAVGIAVGEWNSLAVLVERLRTAVDRSGLENSTTTTTTGTSTTTTTTTTTTSTTALEDSGIDSEEDLRTRDSMEGGGVGGGGGVRHDADLALLDVPTALSRLREALERIDIGALAGTNAVVNDPSSRLHLLRLVYALLSRLGVPLEDDDEDVDVNKHDPRPSPSTSALHPEIVSPSSLQATPRKRRSTRHTVGVSVEELARARKLLEDQGAYRPGDIEKLARRASRPVRQVVESRQDDARALDRPETRVAEEEQRRRERHELEERQERQERQERPQESIQRREQETEEVVVEGRVGRLAEVLRRKAEATMATNARCPAGNKFVAKKAKMKRANTIDIPSYLKLQAESIGKAGCCQPLRRPIDVADRAPTIVGTTATIFRANPMIPSFLPRTENDRKFLALIGRNNDRPGSPASGQSSPAKTFANPRALTDVNWNSRFADIKTTFDKPPPTPANPTPATQSSRRPTIFHQDQDASAFGRFTHASSSPFRRIDKPKPPSTSASSSPAFAANGGVSLRERARMMFDRENNAENVPRPPWIDRGHRAPENGRIDYRTFCKQFAPAPPPPPPAMPVVVRRIEPTRYANVREPIVPIRSTFRNDACVQTEIRPVYRPPSPPPPPPPPPPPAYVEEATIYYRATRDEPIVVEKQDYVAGGGMGFVRRYAPAIATVSNGLAASPEDEIQRHNELQRSIAMRLRSGVETTSVVPANRVSSLRDAYEHPRLQETEMIGVSHDGPIVTNGVTNGAPIDSSDEYLVSCASKPRRSIVLAKSESWHQLALGGRPPVASSNPTTRPPKPRSPGVATKLRPQKQYEASSTADSVKRMESKIRRYFATGTATGNIAVGTLARSHTMPGNCQEGLASLVDGTDFDKAFDDIFEETTRNNRQY